MKKFALFLMIALIVTACAQNLEELKARHMQKMNQFGDSHLLNNRDAKMIFMTVDNQIASACLTETVATAYMEQEGRHLYWSIKKEGNCLIITLKFEFNETVFTKTFKICHDENSLSMSQEENDRIKVDWDCLKEKAPGCIACLTNWPCWLACLGSAAWKCVKLW